jgi:very-short-patch-repair endonuclease
MKNVIITLAALALLATTAISCQKETDDSSVVPITCSKHNVIYHIDGATHYAYIHSETEWHAFMERMFALARQGHRITVCRVTTTRQAATKETVTYKTSDHEDAKRWAKDMIAEGYEVDITYDEENCIYIVTAILE